MLGYDANYKAAVEGNVYDTPDYPVRVTVALPGGVYPDLSVTVDSCEIDASLVTDMPDGTRFADGYPSVSCDLVLSGTIDATSGMSIADLLSPYNTGSPLYRQSVLGCNVTVDVGIYEADGSLTWLRKFTGTIDTLTVDPVAGTVELSCIDLRNMLRSLPDLPPVITAPPYNAGLTSEFAVDYLLRQATSGAISSGPAQRPNCLLSVGLRSSLWAEAGSLDTTYTQPLPSFVSGPWGTGLAGFDNADTDLDNPVWDLASISSDVFCRFFVSGVDIGTAVVTLGEFVGTGGSSIGLTGLKITASPTGVGIAFFTGGSATLTASPAAGPHVVGVHAHYDGAHWSGTIYLDGSTHAFSGLAPGPVVPSQLPLIGVSSLSGGAVVAELTVTTETAPSIEYPFTPQAVLDPSLNTLQVIPALSGDPWQIIQQIADAEQGVAGFDESGIFRFTNRDTLKSSTSVRTVTSATSLKALQFTQSQGSTYGPVTVPFDGWTFGKAGLLYAITGVHSIPAHTTRTWTVTLPDGVLAASVDNNASVLPSGHTTNDGNSWFRCSSDSGGLNEYLNVVVTLAITTPSRVTITVQNKGASRAWMISPAAKAGGGTYTDITAGTPALWIGGQPVTAADEATTTFTVDPTLPALSLDSNPWIQDDDTAAQLAFDLADDLSIPKPDLTNIEIVPDPRLQLEDRVEIVDPDTSGIDEYAILWGWSLSLSDTDWSMSINARAVAAPGQWILGVAGRTELGSTTFI